MEQLDELRRASRYPRRETTLPAHRGGATVDNMQRAVVLHGQPVIPKGVGAEDPDNAFLLSMALACEAEYLVTGSRRAGLLERGSIGRARIATLAAFCADALWRHARQAAQKHSLELLAAADDGAIYRRPLLNNRPLCPARCCTRSRRSSVAMALWCAARASSVVDTRPTFAPATAIGSSPTAPRSSAQPSTTLTSHGPGRSDERTSAIDVLAQAQISNGLR